jgi:tetratricopeptide (TPR) repeat protein
MVDIAGSAVHEVARQPDEVIPPSSLHQKPLRGVTLGSWGLAHLTGMWSGDGQPCLIGRELESIRLLHTLDVVLRERSPAIVTISAPAGMGKSRLIEETLKLARTSAFEGRIFSVAALPGDENNAVIARLLRARFGLELGGDPAVARATLLEQVGRALGDARVADMCFFLGRLLGIAFDETPLSKALSHNAFHTELTLGSILCDFFAADARLAPLYLVVEDLHYADECSLTLLMTLLEEMDGAALTICSARLDFFARHEHFTHFASVRHEHLELPPLERADTRSLMKQMLGPGATEYLALEDYLAEAGHGSPGLMLQLSRELLAAGAVEMDEGGRKLLFRPERLPPLDELGERPEMVEARLLELPSPQRLALEVAAVVGNVCWYGLWARLIQAAGLRCRAFELSKLDEVLAALVRGGHLLLVPDSRIEGEPEYVFRRANERELILRRLPTATRRVYHGVAADWLSECTRAEQRSELAALLAHHLAGSGSSYRAALNYLIAAELAQREGADLHAVGYFRQGLAELGGEDNRRRIDALHAYGVVLANLGRPGPARAAFMAMLKLAEQMGLPSKQGAALNRLGRIHRESGQLLLGRQYFERACAAFEIAGDDRGISATKDDLGKLLWLEGDSSAALALLRAGLEGRKRLGDRRSVAVSLAHLAPVWDERGKAGVAEEALGIAHQLFSTAHDVGGCCDTQLALGRVATHRRDLPRAELYFRNAVELATATADRARMAIGLLQLGETRLRMNDLVGAEPLLEQACSIAAAIEAWLGLAEAKRGLAKLQLKKHRLADARKSIRASLHLARKARSRPQLTATLRTLADVAAAGAWGPSAEGRAMGYYMRSIELAKEIENELELAKGYRSLARYAERYERQEIVERSTILRGLSDEIFKRHEERT